MATVTVPLTDEEKHWVRIGLTVWAMLSYAKRQQVGWPTGQVAVSRYQDELEAQGWYSGVATVRGE